MTHFNNLITMTNVMKHNSRTAVNPDGQPTVNRQSRLMLRQGYLRNLAMIFAVLVLSMANVGLAWADTELANINFKSWTPQSISAGSTVNGCYFKSAVTISADKGASFGGNATTSSNWVAIPLSGINGSITITLTHANSKPQWKNYFKGLNAAPSSSDLSSSPSSVGDNTRPGSNTTTSSWTISTDKLYGVFYVGKGSNGLNDIYSISISTPDWTYYYRGADNSWGGTEMTKSSAGFYSYKSSTTNNHQFKIAKSTEGWDYNYSFVDAGYLGTSITTIGDYGKDNCYIWSAPASYYIIVFRPGSVMNTTANPKICASATLPAEKFTISFNNGGGSGSMSSISNVLYGSEKVTPANTFTKSGYRFTGWKANVDVKVGGATKTAGTLLDDEVTIQEIKSDITLTAQWEVDDGCNKIFAFAYSTDATNAGVTNSTSTFTGFSTGSNDCSGSITIDGKLYSVTKRGSNSTFSITFSVPANKVGTLFGLANSSGTSARTLTLSNGDGYSRTQSSSASKTSATAITYTDMPAGSYTLSADNGASVPLLCLKLCAAGECEATQPGTISKGTLSGCSLRLTAAGSPETNNTWYWQSSADGTDKTESGATKDVTTTGTYYIRSFCSTGSGCWSDARTVTVSASDLTPAAPTALAKSSVTAKGVKLTVTDPANTNNYDLYVSTSSTAPTSGSTPTYTISESKSKTITNLVAGTTYYAWARAKCGSNKSTWTALGDGGNFTTSTVTVTHTLTNVTKTSGAETAGGSNYTAEFAAVSGYSMPTPTVTIDGKAATSGTDYTWSSGTLTIPANKINGNIVITLNSAAAAPSSVAITGNWLYFAGETIELTATPTGGNGPVTYQWYKGGKENGNAIEGATTATYTKATCAFDDAGSYYCKVTCGGSQSTWGQSGDAYNVKIPRLYVKTGHNYDPAKTDFGNVDFTRATASTATASIVLGSNWDYCFNIADGCGHYYGNAGTMQYNNCGPWTTNVNNQDCGLRTTNGATYVFTINYSNWEQLTTTVTYPVANQAADKVIYFDNNDRNWSTLHYRIGRTDHTQATAMTKVHGTANLYKITTAEYNNFTGWQIGNAAGDNGSGKSIYNTQNAPAITASTAHEGGAVTQEAITVTPTTSKGYGADVGVNDNCEFYNYTITNGMKTQNVSITAPSNGTITVAYTDVEGASQSFTSGNRDLAHTVIITPTATPVEGYTLSGLTVNGDAHTSGNTYTVTVNTTIAATFSPASYTVTLNTNDGTINAGNVTSYTYGTGATLPTNVTKSGFTFGGWYDNSGLTGSAVTTISTTATGNKEYWAKWTEEVASSCITITHFSSNNNSSDGKPDSFSKYLYGYKGSVSVENALTLTSNNTNTAGKNSNVELRLDNSATLRIYANNVTNATPGSFDDVVSVSFDAKLYNSGSTSRTQPYTIKVGGTSVGSGSVVGLASDGYQHVSTGTFAAKDGYVDIVLGNTGSSNTNLYIDNIEICQLPCTDAGLAYASTTVNKADGDAGFTNTLTNSHGVTVSYKSSNPEVATVNGTTGAVSIVGIGATVITATSARQKVSETAYCADEATYTLCVTATASCQLLAYGIQNAAHNDIPGVLGTITNTGAGAQDNYVKLTADNTYFSVKAKSGNFAAGDKVSVRVYNNSSNPQTLGFKIKSTSHTAEIAKKSKGVVEYTLVAGDIESDGTIRIKRSSSNDRYDAIWVERCEACTMPTVTTHPTAASYNQGASATALTAVFDGQGKELSYQWYSNDEADNTTGSIIAGATSTSYTPSTELVGTKYYYCVGKTDCGSVATNVATITINDTHAAPTADWTGTTATPIHGGRGFDVVVAAKNAAGNAVWDGTLDATMLTASTGIDIHDIVVNNTAKTITAKYDVTSAVTNPITFSLTLPATDMHKSATLTHTLGDISLCEGGAEEFYWSANVSSPLTANTAAKLVSKTTDTEIELSGTTSAASSTRSTDKATGIVDGTTYSFLSSDPHHTYIKLSSGEEFHFTTTITATISVQFTTRSGDESGIEIYKTSKSGTLIASKLVTGKGDKFQTLTTGSVDAGTYYVVAKNKEINVGEILVVQGSGSAGTYTPALAWSNDQEDGAMVEKNEDAADFSITATRSNSDAEASLGALTYNSSYPSVATVNETTGQVHIADNIDFGGATYKETTITATLAASGCYKHAQITYVLRVKKDICTEAAGTVRIKTDNGCEGQVLTVTGFETGATGFQWYRNGEEIAEATSQDYTATASGSYSVVTRKTCDVASSNSVEVTIETATATKIVDEWYVKNGRRTPDIALVKTTNATGFTVSPTSIGGCTFELKDDGIIYLHGTQSNGTAPSGMSAGNQEVTITATACVNASPVTITIHQQVETPKPSIAFVVDGTKNGKVTDVNTSHTTSRGLYATDLSAEFNLTACNVYWTTNEQMLRQYYSQFDAVVITDDPNTQEYPGGRAEKESATLGYVNAIGTLIDVRPVLTMEAYVSRLANWDCVKGKPLSPDPREYVLKLQCKEHAIYADLTEDGSLVRQESVDGVDYWYVTMVDKTLSPYAGSTETAEKLPALQGFDGKTNAGMLGIGTIADEALQGGIERQKEPAARMMVLGVNSKAMDALTAPGKHVIINAIKYLLQTDMESLEDCSNYFKGGTVGHERDWHTATNWTSGKVPDPTVRARILVPCEITGVAKAASIDIAVGGRTTRYQSGTRDCEGRLTINADGALIVGGEIHRIESAPNFGVDNLKPTETSDLTVLADAGNNGALIFDNPDGTTNATVHFYSKAYTNIVDGKKKKHWQYFGIPIHEAPIPEFFYGAYTYVWEEQNSAWARRREGSTLYEWDALAVSYGVVMDEQPTYVLYGELTSTQNHTASLTYDGIDGDKGYNLIGNSWTAPIQIANFEDADFGANVEKTVYIHNTGRKEQAGGYTPAEHTSNTPGQWISVAINAPAVPGYEGVKVIPAMQAFEVHATSASTLTLNYDRLVRGVTPTELNTPMRAPRRVSSMEDVDPKTVRMLKVQVADQKTQTSAYIFLHDGFSEMYDNGWDARYSEGNGESAVLYVATPDGNMAMAALPDADGAVLGFAPGQENTYTFSFKYTGDEVFYLNDMQEETSTQINEENTYTFTYSENDMVGRFFISPQPFGVPAITTGNEHIGDEAKPHKFIKDEKIYILVHGVLYDATGKVVK